ncbi:MAG TPA: hypothetical protein VGJ73_18305 [Verrucomicrobiae bacterium]|jgi:hypothetical protein
MKKIKLTTRDVQPAWRGLLRIARKAAINHPLPQTGNWMTNAEFILLNHPIAPKGGWIERGKNHVALFLGNRCLGKIEAIG